MTTENKVKQYTKTQAPEGYWVDARGVMTPESLIKDIDRDREQLVGELVEMVIAASASLRELKLRAFGDIQAFIDLSAEKYGAVKGGKKGISRCTALTGVTRFSAPCRTVSRLMNAFRPRRH